MPLSPVSLQAIVLLRKIPIFAQVPTDDLAELAEQCLARTYEVNETIFEQGDATEKLFLLQSGQVKIIHQEVDGREVILEIIPAGEPFGGATIFLAEQPGTAQAMLVSQVLTLPAGVYHKFLMTHPPLALALIKMLGRRLHSVMEMHILAGERVERRMAHILLKLATRVGRMQEDGILVTIPLSRQDLADMTGTTLETAIRVMSRFRADGLVITQPGGFILLTDLPALEKISQP